MSVERDKGPVKLQMEMSLAVPHDTCLGSLLHPLTCIEISKCPFSHVAYAPVCV